MLVFVSVFLLLEFSACLRFDSNLIVFLFLHRQRALSGKGNAGDASKKARGRDRGDRAVPAPEANAELQINLDVSWFGFSFIVSYCISLDSELSPQFTVSHMSNALTFPE